MEQSIVNEVLLRNVEKLSKQGEREESMMPSGSSPLPEVDEVERIVSLVKRDRKSVV